MVDDKLQRQKMAILKANSKGHIGQKAVAKKRIRGITTDNMCELSMGEMRNICEHDRIKLGTTIPYCPSSNSITEQMIRVLTNAVHSMY